MRIYFLGLGHLFLEPDPAQQKISYCCEYGTEPRKNDRKESNWTCSMAALITWYFTNIGLENNSTRKQPWLSSVEMKNKSVNLCKFVDFCHFSFVVLCYLQEQSLLMCTRLCHSPRIIVVCCCFLFWEAHPNILFLIHDWLDFSIQAPTPSVPPVY